LDVAVTWPFSLPGSVFQFWQFPLVRRTKNIIAPFRGLTAKTDGDGLQQGPYKKRNQNFSLRFHAERKEIMPSIRAGKVRAPRPFPLRAPAILAAAAAAASAFLRGARCHRFSRDPIVLFSVFPHGNLRVDKACCPAGAEAAFDLSRPARMAALPLCVGCIASGLLGTARGTKPGGKPVRGNPPSKGVARNHSRVLLWHPGRSNLLRLGAKARCTSPSREGGARQGARAAARAWLHFFCKAWMVMLIAAS
jgi:hypothetical protein